MPRFFSFFSICFLCFASFGCQNKNTYSPAPKQSRFSRLHEQFLLLQSRAEQVGASTQHGILIDMSLPSSSNRLFVWDSTLNGPKYEGLVAHGHCRRNTTEVEFSNVEDSNCSSHGLYRIGKQYFGKFGPAFKLHGLDQSNSNAYKRFIVLHGDGCVPDKEQSSYICNSEGCPTVSPNMMKALIKLINSSEKPIMLSIFD